jgi:hypothetical protein
VFGSSHHNRSKMVPVMKTTELLDESGHASRSFSTGFDFPHTLLQLFLRRLNRMASGTSHRNLCLKTSLLFLVGLRFIPLLVVGANTIPAPIVVSPSQYWYISVAVLSSVLLILIIGKAMTGHGPLSQYRSGHQLRMREF